MPLMVVCGNPSSGKSTVTKYFCQYMKSKRTQEVVVISDSNNGSFSRTVYNDSRLERDHRAVLKSEVQRLLSSNCLVICDSLNYIKGFRYELFCMAKFVRTTFCVLYCEANEDICQQLNLKKDEIERYASDQITQLVVRFEKPITANRWDSPLFTIKIKVNDEIHEMLNNNSEHFLDVCGPKGEHLALEDICFWLFEGKKLKANESTRTTPLMPADFLHTLDRVTQEIVGSVLEQQHFARPGDTFIVPNCATDDGKVLFIRQRSFAELSSLRRQFITSMKMHPIKSVPKCAMLFVDYLNTNQ
ncbi:unnamed protein product [Thelazia callipaeda]|uniref:Protein KTI12 homolog n=1 Tax=Thelazia callipaeda TaxID=103827 RepID=A0A0N5CL47_THECL|nr:unnamed protein product [Thelazia callipaeda]